MSGQTTNLGAATGLVVAGVGVIVSARHPGRALTILIVFLPVQLFLFSQLFAWGVPAALLRPMGALKDVLGIGIVVAGFTAFRLEQRRLDLLDRLVLIYLLVLALYFVAPQLVAPSGPTDLQVRLLGLRAAGGFALVFLGARYAPINQRERLMALQTLVGVALIVTLLGIYQWLSPDGWLDYVKETARVPDYQVRVLGDSRQAGEEILFHLRERPVRVGSIFLGTFQMADYLLIALAICIERAVRRRISPWLAIAGLGAALVIYLSQGRASILAVVVMSLVALRPSQGRRGRGRARVAAVIVVLAALALPNIGSTRFTGESGANKSADQHRREFVGGLDYLVNHPLGTGLGSSPGIGARFSVRGTVTSDNSLLQVGNELGVLEMLIYIGMLIALLRSLRAAARAGPNDIAAMSLWLGGVGLLVAGMFHHAFVDLSVSITYFALAGLALNPMTHARTESLSPAAQRW